MFYNFTAIPLMLYNFTCHPIHALQFYPLPGIMPNPWVYSSRCAYMFASQTAPPYLRSTRNVKYPPPQSVIHCSVKRTSLDLQQYPSAKFRYTLLKWLPVRQNRRCSTLRTFPGMAGSRPLASASSSESIAYGHSRLRSIPPSCRHAQRLSPVRNGTGYTYRDDMHKRHYYRACVSTYLVTGNQVYVYFSGAAIVFQVRKRKQEDQCLHPNLNINN